MNELSGIERDDRDDREATQHEKLLQQKRFTAALAFMTCKTWRNGEFTTLHLSDAIETADELIANLEAPTR